MSSVTLIIFFALDIGLAIVIAKYQKNNGYKFTNSFIGILIGLIGLTALGITAYLELMKL